MHTRHLASPAPSAFCAWSVLASPFSAGLFASLPASAFPFFPLGTFSPFFAGAFLGLGSGFGGAGLADNLADLLCGSSFTLALSPLASPSAFLLGMATVGDVGAGRRGERDGGARGRSVRGSLALLLHTARAGEQPAGGGGVGCRRRLSHTGVPLGHCGAGRSCPFSTYGRTASPHAQQPPTCSSPCTSGPLDPVTERRRKAANTVRGHSPPPKPSGPGRRLARLPPLARGHQTWALRMPQLAKSLLRHQQAGLLSVA